MKIFCHLLMKKYKDGKEDGKLVEWYLNGQIKSKATYKDDACIRGWVLCLVK